MAKRLGFEEKLAAMRRLRDRDEPEPGDAAAVRKAIADRSNFVSAAAAEVAGAWRLADAAADLEAAFRRFMNDPETHDKLCRAKLAAIQALEKLEHQGVEVFEAASRHVQFEAAWGPPVDTAPPLRAAGLIGMTRIDPPGLAEALADALLDPSHDVRCTAANCLGAVGTDAAALVLRFKCRVGDDKPEVVADALRGLLTISPEAHMAFVREHLDSADETEAEAAALAMGNARLPEALAPLMTRFRSTRTATLRDMILLSVAMLRSSAAIDALLDLVASESDADALAALRALKVHEHDPRLVERLGDVVRRSPSPAVFDRFDRDFLS